MTPYGNATVVVEHEAHVRADPLHVLLVERVVEGEPLWMNPLPKDGRKRSKEINTASSYLDMRSLMPEDCCVVLKKRVEKKESLSPSCSM